MSSGRRGLPQDGSLRFSSATFPPCLAADWGSRVRAPEDLGPHHSDKVDHDGVQHHRLRRGGSHTDRATTRGVAVIAPYEHYHGGHGHGFDQAIEQVRWVLKHPEDEEEAPRRHLADLLYDG